ncbi:MAG: 5'-deoxynucleotidase [Anaerolineae bacterium]|nr:5'-deoxynucleotidase [Anaerolineae bacterium]MCB9108544.1 5'-deoxynucleotidase [Anaerolineales bacterium]
MSHFFAYLAKMKFIQRWGLMRNTSPENIQEHSLQVAMIAHGLAIIKNRRFAGQVNPERVATLALFHDASEVITGDLATPIKNFNPKIKTAYSEIEIVAKQKLFDMLPDELKVDYESIFFKQDDDEPHWQLIKAADKICAYLKCLEELKVGNEEFAKAARVIESDIAQLELPEVTYFMNTYVASFSLTLDELN